MSSGRRFCRLTGRVLLAVGLLLAAARAFGDGPRVPAAPADGLHDDASVLDPAQRAAAAQSVAEARSAGVDLYVAVYSVLIGETIEQRAERLKAAWCPDGNGLIVVADTASNQCTYLSHVDEAEWISTAELQRIFADSGAAAATLAPDAPSAEKILAVIGTLGPRLRDAMLKHRELTRHRVSPSAWWVFGGVTVSVFAFLALGALAIRWFRHRQRATTLTPLYFPTVAVGERFGAPFGGGVIAEVHFGEATKSAPR
jgi:hypothetical protein